MANQYKNKVVYNGTTLIDISDTTAVQSDVASGKTFYTASGQKVLGTGSGGGSTPSATKHTIHFDFSDETDTDIDVYYDDALLATMIQEYTPKTYGQKTVTLAQLDGMTWYEPISIPLNTQLIDYNAVLSGYTIGNDGNVTASDAWNCVTDYTPINPTMTFSFKCGQYTLIGFYNTQKNPIRTVEANNIKDSAEDYVASGYLTPSIIPHGSAYVVLCGNSYGKEDTLSLIRTA